MYNSVLQSPSYYRAGLYIRLSEADEGKAYESDSESVINQRDLLTNYAKNNGYTIGDIYVDDGFSGTDFDRPGFKKLLEDINNKKINMVIVKDLSRLGRDHIMTGYYMENFFPTNQIRFISILEAYDSCKNQASNDSSTFIIACNDYYSKQNSIKIRNVLNEKKKNGKFVGSMPCYGYMRDPDDKGHLIPDPETSKVVKDIFTWFVTGVGITDIVSRLNDNNVLSPSARKNIKHSKQCIYDGWTISSVRKILKNKMYCGDMVQSVQTKINYKSKKKVALDPSMWIVVENTHEAIIDRKTFIEVNTRKGRIHESKAGRDKRLLEDILYCKECGNRLSVSYRPNHDYWSVNCNRYSRDPRRGMCTSHFFPYEYLEKQILSKIKKTCEKYLKALDLDEISTTLKSEKTLLEKNIRDNKEIDAQISKLQNKLAKAYEDKLEGILSSEMYVVMQNKVESEIKVLKNKFNRGFYQQLNSEEFKKEIPEYKEKIKKLLDLNNPTRELLLSLINKIEVDENKNIEIYYKYDIIEREMFTYENIKTPRNPYGRKGKSNK